MEEVKQFQPWFGMEQEYTLFGLDEKPFGWPPQGVPFRRGGIKNKLSQKNILYVESVMKKLTIHFSSLKCNM